MRPRPAQLQCLGRNFTRCPQFQCRQFTSDRIIKEHDVVLLRQRGEKKPRWRLTKPLRPGDKNKVKLPYGATLDAEQLIGRRMLDVVKDSSGREVLVHEASMASYIVQSERLATPIYPHDASTIVSMMDLHPERPGEEEDAEEEPFEVFEAGTGMGSLTLHIARALHAANPGVGRELRDVLPCTRAKTAGQRPDQGSGFSSVTLADLDFPEHLQPRVNDYLASRRAVLHTLDHKLAHSQGAYRLVQRFRRGMYLPTVDFHTGSIYDYITARLTSRNQAPFLSRAILDLPAPQDHAASVVQALRPNGLLIIFNPSISQIGEFAAWSKTTHQPLRLERTAELLTSSSSTASEGGGVHDVGGGRAWDLRTVVPKDGGEVVQVMRPKVGERVAGGGFVAVFRKFPEELGEEGEGRVKEEDAEEEEADVDRERESDAAIERDILCKQ